MALVTDAGKDWLARLREAEQHWTRLADEDELNSFDRLARQCWRDCYRKVLKQAEREVPRIEQQAEQRAFDVERDLVEVVA